MTYRQNSVTRRCEICLTPIEDGEWMMDLFRDQDVEVGSHVCWVHEKCARKAMERWLTRKREKEGRPE